MTTTRRHLTGAALLALTTATTGFSAPLEAGEFRARANAICRQNVPAYRALEAVTAKTPREIRSLTRRMTALNDRERIALSRLTPPPALAARFHANQRRAVAANRFLWKTVADLERRAPEATLQDDARRILAISDAYDETARAIGLNDCQTDRQSATAA